VIKLRIKFGGEGLVWRLGSTRARYKMLTRLEINSEKVRIECWVPVGIQIWNRVCAHIEAEVWVPGRDRVQDQIRQAIEC